MTTCVRSTIYIFSFMKFCPVVTLLWLILWILNHIKGYNLCTAEASPLKLDVHQRVKVMSFSLRTDFTSKLVHGLALGIPKFYIAPYAKINHALVNLGPVVQN